MANGTNPQEAWTTTGSTGGVFNEHLLREQDKLRKAISMAKKLRNKSPDKILPPVEVVGEAPAQDTNLASPVTNTSARINTPSSSEPITNPTNPYEFMIGGTLPNEEQMKLMAGQLRGMDTRAVLAALSGDKALTAAGGILTDKSDKLATGLAKTRKTIEDRDFTSEENRIAAEAKLKQDEIDNVISQTASDLAKRQQDDKNAYDREYLDIIKGKNEQTKQLKLAALNAKTDEKNKAALIKLNEDYEKGGILDLEASMAILDNSLAPYLTETGGVGPDGIPGIGNIQGIMPEFAMTAERSEIRANFEKIANTILKARSGAAVTPPEMKRLAKELQRGIGTSDEKMMTAYNNLKLHTAMIREAMKQGMKANTVDDLRKIDLYIASGAPTQLADEEATLDSAEIEIIMDETK